MANSATLRPTATLYKAEPQSSTNSTTILISPLYRHKPSQINRRSPGRWLRLSLSRIADLF